MSKYTPGPWSVGKQSPNGLQNIGSKGLLLAQCCLYSDERKEENKANAQLIAAAPEMYEALNVVNGLLFEFCNEEEANALELVEKVIAKAEGK